MTERLLTHKASFHAPHLVDLEVAHTLRRLVFRDGLPQERARQALMDLVGFRLRRYPHQVLLPRVWTLRENLTAYDAAYVALAESLDATLLTRDGRIARAPGHSARVEVF